MPRMPLRIALISSVMIFVVAPLSARASAQDDGYVVYLSEYLSGDYYVAPLGDVDGNGDPPLIQPRKLTFSKRFRGRVDLGNHDVSVNGKLIVFAARWRSDWDIYTGAIDLDRGEITNVQRIIHERHVREEDPRLSWDGTRVVYKCDGNICIYPPDPVRGNPVVKDDACELWAPSFDPSGEWISYARRCNNDPAADRIWEYGLLNGTANQVPLPSEGGGPDRFAHFMADAAGAIVYSHISYDAEQRARASLWRYSRSSGAVSELHDRTESDDDPYPDKHDSNHIAFIGWENGGYDLFIYRQATNDSVRLTNGISVLAPVLFR